MELLNRSVVTALPLVPKPLVRKFANRYIAGDTIEDAVRVIRQLNQKGMMATLDVLGEHITQKTEAEAMTANYLEALEVVDREKIDSNVSIKLTAFGLKLDFDFCLNNVRRVMQRALELKNFIRIDMEDSTCTTDTLRIYDLLRREYRNVGVAIQAYLRRSLADVRTLMQNSMPTNIRLCKGIYIEPRAIAYKNRELINKNFTYLLAELLRQGAYVGIATHDERLVWDAMRLIDELKLPREKYEFQMLLGVDEELRDTIVQAGHRLRVYVPFGKFWYAYSVRRLKENPQVAGYVIQNILGLRST
ncbi:MAG: proline dehydrogenase family protein [candidate division KSB1 bacterium]|nr:proline dehydrogenase family protein [candidate division KSB1 bacterium]MDZ7303827.1 proline dehydrogenase family protein [candidate division KSB1 bacterium]MDZ7312728.1 proline dehydrogenase family protein [candidate division KSB1 bacterium]